MLTETIENLDELKVGDIFEVKKYPDLMFMKINGPNKSIFVLEIKTLICYGLPEQTKPEDILVYPNAKMNLRFVAS